MEFKDDAAKAIEKVNGYDLHGAALTVEWGKAKKKPPISRS